jgi:hypothetical protein
MLACLVMHEIGTLETAAWGLCFALQVALLCLILARRHYLQFPAFTVYLAGSIAQGVIQFELYRLFGYLSESSRIAAWSVQAVVTLLRCVAVLEVCRHVFASYRGIWALIWRVLLFSVPLVVVLTVMSSTSRLDTRIYYADRAASLAISMVIVAVVLLARFYRVQALEPTRSIAIGFFLFSCFTLINDTVLETLWSAYGPMWAFLGTCAFIACLLVWGWALRNAPVVVLAPQLIPAGVYKDLSPEVNRRLSTLNERLRRIDRPKEQPRS